MNHFAVMLTLLRDRPTFLDEIRRNIKIERKSVSLLVSSCLFFAIYGAIIGSSSSWLQAVSSAIKLPALYLITLVICLPTLFFFDILFSSKLGFGQYFVLLLTTMSTISVLLFSFAPITLFFLISIHDYSFFLLLNVAIFALTGFVGVRLFYSGMQQFSSHGQSLKAASEPVPYAETQDSFDALEPMPAAKRPIMASDAALPGERVAVAKKDDLYATRVRLLKFWLVLYALVGSQLGWTLRPFFGAPGETFQLFRAIEGNFYSTVLRTFWTLMGFN